MNSICVICSEYPNKITPAAQVFVQQFVWALAETGLECTVICPLAPNLNPMFLKVPSCVTETTYKGSTIKIYFPKFISLGQRDIIGLKTARITTELYYRAVLSTWKNLQNPPEVIYGHFITPPGICASRISKKYKIPSFAAYGESTPWSVYNYGKKIIKRELQSLNGIVAVSTANREGLKDLQIFPSDKIRVFPNGIRLDHFYPRNKANARKKLGFNQKKFIIAYMGEFSERKGIMRVAEAIKNIDNISVAFGGSGPLSPTISNYVYKGPVKPEDVPDFLSAADAFVLPTLNEGCCNAIIEAMACGLPIISSNLPFNKDILNPNNSILIDPSNIDELRKAIIYLRDNLDIRISMGKASWATAKQLSIEMRAQRIRAWLKEMV